jgi:hypothetical protein
MSTSVCKHTNHFSSGAPFILPHKGVGFQGQGSIKGYCWIDVQVYPQPLSLPAFATE